MTALPTTFDGAVALIGELVHDPNLALGMQTVFVVIAGSGVITALILSRWPRR